MPLPNLIHAVPTVIQRLNRTATRTDVDAREPIQAAARLPDVTVPGQPRWSGQSLDIQPHGSTTDDSGYVLYRYIDLETAMPGDEIQIGDRITVQGRIVREVYVTRLEPMGHYPDQQGASLVRAWFKDRNPAKVRR